ncbi:MAG TPA: NAD(P)-binding protein, partial [Candidatus Angelobacter sp.]
MPDTFLEAHKVGPLQFAISAPLTPISIRDQMVRAKMFVDRAVGEALIGPARPLFVVGAGAGGVAAAVYAARQGVPTSVIEILGDPFGLQSKCFSRLVNPTQYDWPADHWSHAIFPWRNPVMPLPWAAARANRIAAAWKNIFNNTQRHFPLTVHYFSQLTSRTFSAPRQDLEIIFEKDFGTPATRFITQRFGAALFAVGFGQERSSIGPYKAFDFWETEDFENPRLGVPPYTPARPVRVLICGGGDGALQDFLRITTGEASAADILQKLLPYMPGDWSGIYSSEDQGHRANLWNSSAEEDHVVMTQLEDVHRIHIHQLLSGAPGSTLLKAVVALLAPAGHLQVALVHTCTHFSRSYALNRFLVRLIEECALQAGLAISVQSGAGVNSV